MNRRLFLQSVSAIALVKLPALPSYANASTLVPTPAGGFEWIGPTWRDYGNKIALSLRLPNGRINFSTEPCRKDWGDDQRAAAVLKIKRRLIQWADRMVKEGKA